jgi:drug/metabolite transporter (DMT)-like permease
VIPRTRIRRAIGAVFVIIGAILMWMAPGRMFDTSLSGAGLGLLLTGIALELVGIALERRDENRRLRRTSE